MPAGSQCANRIRIVPRYARDEIAPAAAGRRDSTISDSAMQCLMLAKGLDDATGYYQLLHLRRALIDAEGTDLRVESRDRLVRHHTEAAEDLHGGVNDLLGRLRRRHLGHR